MQTLRSQGRQSAEVPRPLRALKWLLLLALPSWAAAQDFDFRPPASAADATVAPMMRDLAERILPVYQEKDPERYLTNLSALQAVAGNFTAAEATRQSLRERRQGAGPGRLDGGAVLDDIYVHARTIEAVEHISFARAFTRTFRDALSRLSDQDAYAVTAWRGSFLSALPATLQNLFDQQRGKATISLSAAVDLVWTYFSVDAYGTYGPLIPALDAEDDRRRYFTDSKVLIKTGDGASISAVLVRPRIAPQALPTLLEFTIYVDSQNYAKECAAHGYVGVVAYARGRGRSSGSVIPYQHDGDDVRAVIGWIAKQPWSDGRVGMYGGSYSGFVQWAAARRLPKALKAIAASAAMAPGIDFPMEGNIFKNAGYRWALEVTTPKGLDGKSYNDEAQWRSFDEAWYTSGRPYLDLDRVYGQDNRFFHRWLNHPSYDGFWQKMIPYREQFGQVNIPVLATTGYFAGGEVGALYYFTQHYRFNPRADQTLLIGPYDDAVMRHGSSTVVQGYQVDRAALIDLHDLRYQWFDYVLKGGAKPALLADRVNYEVMGANEWRHAPSLAAMANGSLRFYLDAAPSALGHVLAQQQTSGARFIRQTVNLADRSDASWAPPPSLLGKSLEPHNGVAFVSEPLTQSIEIDGLLSGRLDFTANKMDMDLNVTLYELLPSGDYLQLFGPAFEFRASYARDRVHRHLLKAGERQQLTFSSERMTSRRLQPGSRVVVVLDVNKRPDQEINYGTGDDVRVESITDAKVPLKIRWYSDSYLDIPVRR
jgi:putative CocE/NonD family hydrolase